MDRIGRVKPYGVRIGVICDSFFYESMCSAADLRYIPPEDAFFERVKDVDLLLVVSTWHGLKQREWHGMSKEGSPLRERILALIADCRRNHVRTVFYSKEDPPNFELFKTFAVACDYVFTTCEEKVGEYQALCGHDRVWVMPFCVNTDFSNPIDSSMCQDDRPVVVFSGSWIKKYPQRCAWLRTLFDGVVRAGRGLLIYDRNSWRENPKWRFPASYADVHPTVEHKELLAIHKRHGWALNVNSVVDSATMFAVRVFELLAAGVHVVSNYSLGMHRMFPAVSIGYSVQTVADILRRTPKGVLVFQRACGIREVITHYAAHDVLGALLARVGFPQQTGRPLVAVIADDEEAAEKAFALQTCRSFKVIGRDAAAAGGCRGFDGMMCFSADAEYSPFFIEDAVNVLAYTDFDAVSADAEERLWYRVAPAEQGDGRYLVARCGTALADALVSGSRLPSDTGCFILPIASVDGTVYGNCGVAVATQQRLVVRISVGDDWKGLLLATLPSLLRCRRLGECGIVLADVSEDSPLARHFAARLARDFGNVRVADGGGAGAGCAVELRAGDEVFASAFDRFAAKVGGALTASVTGDVLLCGRSVRLLKRGVSVRKRGFGLARRVREPVMCRYGVRDESLGEIYSPPRKSVVGRMLQCYRDNGLWKTVRRALLGKRPKGRKVAGGGAVR